MLQSPTGIAPEKGLNGRKCSCYWSVGIYEYLCIDLTTQRTAHRKWESPNVLANRFRASSSVIIAFALSKFCLGFAAESERHERVYSHVLALPLLMDDNQLDKKPALAGFFLEIVNLGTTFL